MKAAFSLTPAESKRLIAKAITQMPEVRAAWEKAYIILVGSTINGFIAQELLGLDIDPHRYTVGINTSRVLCVTEPEGRHPIPIIVHKGQIVETTVPEAFEDFHLETVLIKGANAVDPEGNVGVITSSFDGGTIAATIGTIASTGMRYIFAVGLEKLVPSVREAAQWAGAKTQDYSMGANFGMYCISDALVVTEIEALRILTGVETKLIAAGGVGGSEGSVVLISEGEADQVKQAVEIVESVKGEPPVPGRKATCEICPYACLYQGIKEEDLPKWLQKT